MACYFHVIDPVQNYKDFCGLASVFLQTTVPFSFSSRWLLHLLAHNVGS
jgi:hypothetical protein